MKQLISTGANAQQTDMPVEKLYSIQEAAPLLGISVSTLRNWIREEPPRIESRKAGKKLIRIPESEIIRHTSTTPEPVGRPDIQAAIENYLRSPEGERVILDIVNKGKKR